MPDVSAPIAEEGKQTSGRKKRAWPVTAAGILLILQAVFLFCLFPVLVGIEIYQLPDAKLAWLLTTEGRLAPMHVDIVDLRQLQITLVYDSMKVPVPGRVVTSFLYFLFSFPILINAFLLLRLWQHAWTMAIFWQGSILAASLFIYFNYYHPYIYLLMGSGIFMVFYMNTYEVQRVFLNFVQPVEKK